MLGIAHRKIEQTRLGELGLIAGGHGEVESLNSMAGGNEDVYVGTNAESGVVVK
jgi:hypothetical protein